MKLSDFVVSEAILADMTVSSKDAIRARVAKLVAAGEIKPEEEAKKIWYFTKEEPIRAMVASLKQAGSIDPDEEESIIKKLMEREELGSTGIGNGVAIPHTKHPSVSDPVSTVAIVKDGVDFESLDHGPVYILFLLISPPERSGDHLRGLENISRHLRNQKFCSFLRQARGRDDIVELLREADNNELDD
jgi:PTS system nitrogen regulatory IIA component